MAPRLAAQVAQRRGHGQAAGPLQRVRAGELVQRLHGFGALQGRQHAAAELIGAGRGDHDHGPPVARVGAVGLGDAPGDGGVRVHGVVALRVDAGDGLHGLFVVRPAGGKALDQRAVHRLPDGVRPAGLERLHPGGHQRPIPIAELVEQALEVGGDEDVHGGRGRLVEGTVRVVDALLDEIEQHVVGVAGADELAHGQAHALGVIGGEDVAEVAGGHAEVDLVAQGDDALFQQVRVGGEVVGHLRHQASPVDGVRAGELHALFRELAGKGLVAKDALDAGLRVVKVALYGADVGIFALLGDHLELLRGRDAVDGVEHADLRSLHAAEPLQRGLARVAGGGHEDEHLLVHAGLLHGQGHQPREHLQGHVLEGVGGAVPELEDVQVPHVLERRGAVPEALRGVGLAGAGAQLRLGKVGQIRAHDLPRAVGIGLLRHVLDAAEREGRKALRHIQAAVRGEPGDDRLRRVHLFGGRTGADVLHLQRFLFLGPGCRGISPRCTSSGTRGRCRPWRWPK